jgi:hypothetical protein
MFHGGLMDHFNVLIATPGRSVEMAYLKSLLNTLEVLQQQNITYKFINQYSSQVAAAREGTAMNDNFLDITNNKPLLGQATYDVMFWIDSDIEWTPDDFLKLYRSDKDITSGIYLSDQAVLMYSPSDKADLEKTEHIEITHAGFGFIAIKQGVFESLSRPWFQTQYTKTEINGQEYVIPYGEDYSFCSKARSGGYKIFLDPTVKVTHYKTIAIKSKE